MLNDMIKQAGTSLRDRVKIAAAIVVMHQYDRTQDVLGTAGQIKTAAAHDGINMPDEMAIEAAAGVYADADFHKNASLALSMTKTAAPAWLQKALTNLKAESSMLKGKAGEFMTETPWALPAVGAGVGAGTGALVDGDNRLRGALIGGGIGGLAGLGGQLSHTAKGLNVANKDLHNRDIFGQDWKKILKLEGKRRGRTSGSEMAEYYKALERGAKPGQTGPKMSAINKLIRANRRRVDPLTSGDNIFNVG